MLRGESFTTGTISTTVSLNGKVGDNGIIFNVSAPGDKFWEEGASFYFFFISNIGEAYLGEVNCPSSSNSWEVRGIVPISGLNRNVDHVLAVSIDENKVIRCFVDDILYITYQSDASRTGTGYGVRMGTAGVTFSSLAKSSTVKIPDTTSNLSGYTIANGNFSQDGNVITSTTGNALAYVNNSTFKYGTLETTITLSGTASDNGIVFGLSHATETFWEGSGVSFYFFFLNKDGGGALLGRSDNGSWSSSYGAYAGHTATSTATYTLKVVTDDTTIYCYVNNTLVITYADAYPLSGTEYGIRAGTSGVSYGAISCSSTDTPPASTTPTYLDIKSGGFVSAGTGFKSNQTNNISILTSSPTTGTLSANVKGVTNAKSGLIFNYTDNNNYYKFYTNRATQTVKLSVVEAGVERELYSNFLSAGYYESGEFPFKVVVKDGKAYCYFWNTLYTTQTLTFSGNGFGFYAEGSGTLFTSYSMTEATDVITTNTLLFGHSYFEMWRQYVTDFTTIANSVDDFGTFHNIGIGGSVAEHWWNFRNSLLEYQYTNMIYMIGINDISGAYSPASTAEHVENLIKWLETNKKPQKLVLVGVARCPARNHITDQITSLNNLYKNIAASYDWVYFAECEYAFCDDNGNAQSSWFIDELHPSDAGYTQKLVPAIISAWKGENQPSASAALADAKTVKMGVLASYTEQNFRSAEWATAKTHYDSAVAKINACTTVSAVDSVDLTNELNSLATIKSNGDYHFDSILNQTYYYDSVANRNFSTTTYEDASFTNYIATSTNGQYNLRDFGQRLDNSISYTDMSFTFKLSDLSGDVGLKGVLFRSYINYTNRTINGYLINYVSNATQQYLQILYLYNSTGLTHERADYMGGWVFPGTVGGTEFRAVVSGNTIKLYTEADYVAYGEAAGAGCVVDLTSLNGTGTVTPYTSGYFGVFSNDTATAKLEVSNIAGSSVRSSANLKAQQITYNINNNSNCLTVGNTAFTNAIGGLSYINMSGMGYRLDNTTNHTNAVIEFSAESPVYFENTAILLRASQHANGGVNGICVNVKYNANQWYLQLFRLSNAFKEDETVDVAYDYLGGIVLNDYALISAGLKFKVVLSGSTLTVTAEAVVTPEATCSVTATNLPITSAGLFGVGHNDNNANTSIKLDSVSFS